MSATVLPYTMMLVFLSQIINDVEPPEGCGFCMLPSLSEQEYSIWILPQEIVEQFRSKRGII